MRTEGNTGNAHHRGPLLQTIRDDQKRAAGDLGTSDRCEWNGCKEGNFKHFAVRSLLPAKELYGLSPIRVGVVRRYCTIHAAMAAGLFQSEAL